MVALNAHDDLTVIGQVEDFVRNLGVTYPVGIEQSETYEAVTQNYEGLNPFPVTLLVDRSGIIRFIAREYDGDTLTQKVEELLAE